MTAEAVAPSATDADTQPLLSLRGIQKSFGPVHVLRGVELERKLALENPCDMRLHGAARRAPIVEDAVVELIGGDDEQDRPESRERARYAQLPEGHQGQQSRDEMPRHHRRSVPS